MSNGSLGASAENARTTSSRWGGPLLGAVRENVAYCNEVRPHQAPGGDLLVVRCVPRKGEVIAKPVHGRLHGEYSRAA